MRCDRSKDKCEQQLRRPSWHARSVPRRLLDAAAARAAIAAPAAIAARAAAGLRLVVVFEPVPAFRLRVRADARKHNARDQEKHAAHVRARAAQLVLARRVADLVAFAALRFHLRQFSIEVDLVPPLPRPAIGHEPARLRLLQRVGAAARPHAPPRRRAPVHALDLLRRLVVVVLRVRVVVPVSVMAVVPAAVVPMAVVSMSMMMAAMFVMMMAVMSVMPMLHLVLGPGGAAAVHLLDVRRGLVVDVGVLMAVRAVLVAIAFVALACFIIEIIIQHFLLHTAQLLHFGVDLGIVGVDAGHDR